MPKDAAVPQVTKSASGRRDEAAMDHLFTELPQGSQYVVLRRQSDRDATKWDHCAKIPTADFSTETVKEQFGGGIYSMQPIGERGKFLSNPIEFSIDPRFKPTKGPLAVAIQSDAGGATVGGGALARLEKLLEMNLMLQMQGANTARAEVKDPWEGAVKIAALLKDSHAPAAAITAKDVTDLLFKGMDLGARMNGGEKNGFAALAESASPLFGAMAKNIEAAAEATAARTQLRLVQGGKGNTDPGASTTMQGWQEMVRPHIPKLLALATADKDPDLYADLVLDQLADAVLDQIEGEARKLDATQFGELFFAAFPELASQRPWCEKFFGCVHAALLLDPEPEPS